MESPLLISMKAGSLLVTVDRGGWPRYEVGEA
jgi:hypothetical protein